MTHVPPDNAGDLVHFVTRAGRHLADERDVDALLARLGRLVVPHLADLCVALVYGSDPPRLEVAGSSEAAAAAARAVLEAHVATLERLAPARSPDPEQDPGPRWRWLPTARRPLLERFARGDAALVRLIADLGIESLLTLPLWAHGRTLGVLLLAHTVSGRKYGAAELAAAQVLARRAALALDAASDDTATLAPAVQRARAEESRRKWAHVFAHASWGAAILDTVEHRIEMANRVFARMHGFENPDALVGRPYVDLVPPEERAQALALLRLAAGEAATAETRHARLDGQPFPVLLNVTAVEEPAGPPLYLVVNVQDLTGIKRTEARLHNAQRLETVGRLAGGVAHEVNNMMTVVLGFADLLLQAADFPPGHRADLTEIRKAADRASTITRQLLAFGRRQILHAEPLELNALVGESVRLLHRLLPSDVEVEVHPCRDECWVLVDRTQIEQVLVNLAFNARDAMPRGGRLQLAVSRCLLEAQEGLARIGVPFAPGPYGQVTVEDTGHGMDPQTLARLFEPFFTTKELGRGTGLGLSTVYGIVKQSGGYVWVESVPDEGTRFTLCLPEASPRASEDEAQPEPRAAISAGGATILLVEDEPAVRELAHRALRAGGYQVALAASGREALRELARQGGRVGLVLTDVVMPDMGGVELRERLAELQPHLPVIYMSAYPDAEVRELGLVGPEDSFLQKPFPPELLLRAVADGLARAAAAGPEW